jgi:hypothetical protein
MEGEIVFIIGNRPQENNGFFCHLGHELHGARSLIFDLLCKNIITVDQTTIITMRDRIFLYSHVFKKMVAHEDPPLELQGNYKHVIVLNELVKDPGRASRDVNYFHSLTNNVFKGLYNPIGFNNYKNDIFKKLVTNCNIDILQTNLRFTNPFDTEFIIVHYRNYKNNKHIWNHTTDETIDNLNNLLNSLKNNFPNILLFGNIYHEINIEGLNIKKSDNLEQLVYYMKLDNCKMIVSQWSGAAQLGQFFFSKQILYYYIGDQLSVLHHIFYEDNYYNNLNNSYSWDYQTFSMCKRYWFKDINHLIKFFKKDGYYEKLDDIYDLYIGTEEWVSLENIQV